MESNSVKNQPPLHKRKGGKLSGIDGLKGIAIIGVTLFHMMPEVVPGGYLGVSLFLLLTGYLLAYTNINEYFQRRYSLKEYFWKRIKRIYPGLLIVILVTLGVNSLLVPKSINGIRPEIVSILLGYNNIWQIFQNADYFTRLTNTSPFTHLWFLGIEIQYFIIWPILFFLFRKICQTIGYRGGLVAFALLALGTATVMPLLYTPNEDVTRLYYGTDTRIYALLFGAFLGILRAHRKHVQPLSPVIGAINTLVFIALMIGLVVAYALLNGQYPIVYQYMMLLVTFGFCALILLAEYNRLPVAKVLNTHALGWFGKRSYGIFLWQYPVIYLFQQLKLIEYFGNEVIYNLAIIAIILLLTIWSDAVSAKIAKGVHISVLVAWLKRIYIRILSIIGCVIMVVGLFALFTASDEKIADLSDLQNRLQANEAIQQEENEKARNLTVVDPTEIDQALTGVAAIGDSVMLGASPALRTALPGVYIDAKVSRYVGAGLDIAKAMDAENRLGKVVLISLGTNGPITGYYEDETKALINYLGPDREIFWINTYAPDLEWEKPNNDYLDKLAKDHKNITVIDWYSAASKHPEWLSDDGVHPNDLGVENFAKLVREKMAATLVKADSR